MELNHVGSKTIETNNLILNKIEESDYNNVYSNLFNNNEVCIMQDWRYYSSYEEFFNAVSNNLSSINNYDWIIFEKNTNSPVGMICINSMLERNFKCEIGYGIHPNYQNKGYATESLIAVSNFLINEVGFNRIVCKCKADNIASKKVMEKANFIYEGTERQSVYKNDHFVDLLDYSLIKEDLKNTN